MVFFYTEKYRLKLRKRVLMVVMKTLFMNWNETTVCPWDMQRFNDLSKYPRLHSISDHSYFIVFIQIYPEKILERLEFSS